VSILRAGNGMLDGMLEILPAARVGHVGLYRDPATLVPVEYYFKVPEDIADRLVIVVDPMLATGHSAVAALNRLKEAGAVTIKYVCLLAAPEGIAALQAGHPEVPIFTAAVDDHLNDHGYIIPGLGDAGIDCSGRSRRAAGGFRRVDKHVPHAAVSPATAGPRHMRSPQATPSTLRHAGGRFPMTLPRHDRKTPIKCRSPQMHRHSRSSPRKDRAHERFAKKRRKVLGACAALAFGAVARRRRPGRSRSRR
jgi:hypothetical protein